MLLPLLDLAGLEGFDPHDSVTIFEPEMPGTGYWAGCPTVLYEPDRSRFLLTYRQRRPRGEAATERGWRCAVAESADGVNFQDIWAVEKAELGTSSMERFAVTRLRDRYLLYTSYVDPADNRWRIDVTEADAPDQFDVAKATPALTAETTGTEGVKDPHPVVVGSSLFLFASYAAPAELTPHDRERAHATADIYTTGLSTFPTGLAISQDGVGFDWRPDVLSTGTGWDRYQARLTTVVPGHSGFLGLYDGSADASENYEERSGVAFSADLVRWTRLTPQRPWRSSPHASGSLRYADVAAVDDEWFVYYEASRADGAHELRLARVKREQR